MTESDASYRRFYDALRTLLARPKLVERLNDAGSTEAVQRELDLSDEIVTDLKNILLLLPQGGPRPEGGSSPLDDQSARSVRSATDFLDSSFKQLRNAARLSLGMSAAIFVVGIGFLVIAAIRSFTDPEGVTGTAVVAGVGIVQILALFYRNPLRDIARASSSAQQARLVIMSYMLGVGLVGESVYRGRSTNDDLARLEKLTEATLRHLEPVLPENGLKGSDRESETRPTGADATKPTT